MRADAALRRRDAVVELADAQRGRHRQRARLRRSSSRDTRAGSAARSGGPAVMPRRGDASSPPSRPASGFAPLRVARRRRGHALQLDAGVLRAAAARSRRRPARRRRRRSRAAASRETRRRARAGACRRRRRPASRLRANTPARPAKPVAVDPRRARARGGSTCVHGPAVSGRATARLAAARAAPACAGDLRARAIDRHDGDRRCRELAPRAGLPARRAMLAHVAAAAALNLERRALREEARLIGAARAAGSAPGTS